MGHTRLGTIPKSQKWDQLVAYVLDPRNQQSVTGLAGNVSVIANRTLDAAQQGLTQAINDPGLSFTFYLLAETVLAVRTAQWQKRLGELGLNVTNQSTVFDLAAEFQGVVDDHLSSKGAASDYSEIAQRAAGEALTELLGSRTPSLFEPPGQDLRDALKSLSTNKGFGELGQKFFGSFMNRFLNFYLSRITASAAAGESVHGVADISRFNEALKVHCEQSAMIVRDFAGEWLSKTAYLTGVDQTNAAGFVSVAIKKLKAELEQQRPRS